VIVLYRDTLNVLQARYLDGKNASPSARAGVPYPPCTVIVYRLKYLDPVRRLRRVTRHRRNLALSLKQPAILCSGWLLPKISLMANFLTVSPLTLSPIAGPLGVIASVKPEPVYIRKFILTLKLRTFIKTSPSTTSRLTRPACPKTLCKL
jgi:hypothetical protein